MTRMCLKGMMALAVAEVLVKQTRIGHLPGRAAKCRPKSVASMLHGSRNLLQSKEKSH